MGKFKRDDLKYTYKWASSIEDHRDDECNSEMATLIVDDGYEILSFINYFMAEYSLEKLQTFHKIERMIKDIIPADLRSKEDIRIWLLKNWKKY
jgi:hypothetical protein